MRNNSLKSSLILCVALLLALNTPNYAQFRLVPVNHQVSKELYFSNRQVQQIDTIQLPLWDDFSAYPQQKTNNIWQNIDQVYVNNGLAYLPPSYNVASLDGFDANGSAYATESDVLGIGDSLVSKSVDLSNNSATDNINLSFFWQEGYGPTAPDSEDSLRVYFKNAADKWIFMRSIGGSGRSAPLPFQQLFIAVNDENFLHEGFQFKFEYYGNLAGDFDVWSLDYIYLNQGNARVTTTNFRYDSYEDRTFSTITKGIFSGYQGIPLQHLDAPFLNEIIQPGSIIYNNLWAGNGTSTIFGTELFGSVFDTLNPSFLIDSVTANGNFLTSAQDTALFSIQARSKQAIIDYLISQKEVSDSAYLALQFNLGNTDSLFFETIDGTTTYYPLYTFQQNDTLREVTSFHNYYALDDGTAEASLQLNSKSYELAQYYKINGDHFMTAIDMYIPNIAQNSSSQNITLLVLDGLDSNNGEGNVIYAQNVLISPSQQINTFQRFELNSPVPVSNSIYIGYREENDEVVSVGFDKNNNSGTDLYYNQSGTWQKNELLQGSIMMRPVFGEIKNILSSRTESHGKPLVVYPNPSKGTISINQPYEYLKIFGADGRLYYSDEVKLSSTKDNPIVIDQLKDGLYILEIYYKGTYQRAKILLRK
ncbi:MAG: hypothetical protein ACJAT1_001910 [Marivirga sp.]|jgi:hypothetical protein